ncbi:DUF559 domain-containing protein [Microbacterium sp. Mu-80]|uniref:DUF559 domain-containing protein n=1 Tax=Microbacterium bandirmense TaxID=3122050 RepID=A0ABU8LBP1_9MICO
MRHRIALPASLGSHFTVGRARDAGIGRGRSDAADLARPFHGVRSLAAPEAIEARVASLVPRLSAHHRIGGSTAAQLWRLPVPAELLADEDLVVYAPTGSVRPRTRGVKGLRLARERLTTHDLDGAMVLDPVATLFTCAARLSVAQAVILIDAIVTTADNYPRLRCDRPFVTREDIADRLVVWGRFPGCGTIRAALALARDGAESPKETETRMLLVERGLPEPVVQYQVYDGWRQIARVDLAYPDLKIAIEYEGDGHRTSKKQWRRDIQRQRDLEDRGWIVIRLTQQDLTEADAVIARIRNAIATRQRR